MTDQITEHIAKNIGISEGSVSNAKVQLKQTKVKGKTLITISKRYVGCQGRPCDFIKVANIWEENTELCEAVGIAKAT